MFAKAKYVVGISAALGANSGTGSLGMVDIGLLDHHDCVAKGVNEAGAVVGQCQRSDGTLVPTYWAPSAQPVELRPLEQGRPCEVAAINDAGVAVGKCEFGDEGETIAVRWASLPNGPAERLHPRYPDVQSFATLVNPRGTIAGGSVAEDGTVHPVIWTAGAITATVLPDPSDSSPPARPGIKGTTCRITDMTDEEAPAIVAVCDLPLRGLVGVRWTPASPSYPISELPIPEGTFGCLPAAIDKQRQVAGTCVTVDGSVAVRWHSNGTDMVVLSNVLGAAEPPQLSVRSMNAAGTIAGNYVTNKGFTRAFVWQPVDGGGAAQQGTDLGTLGGASTRAFAIGDDGLIGGTAQNDRGMDEAFVWNSATRQLSSLGNLGGFTSTVTAMSERAQIAGDAEAADGRTHAFIAKEGALPPPPIGCNSALEGTPKRETRQ
ncbi:hypothetical protein LVJ94_48530 [Pendulispora rubella]|uniref:Uncharacterized protein n=1 Tax=Pendulispora rubella TaxID=2741070 RepID=A0ABZ2L1B2_9BACT